jgi:hypothetical protein
MDIAAWLGGLGLAQYAAAFAENDITAALLPRLTGEDLRELGVGSIGHRRMLLDAIAALTPAPEGAAAPAIPAPELQAERRQLTVLFCDLVGSTALSAGWIRRICARSLAPITAASPGSSAAAAALSPSTWATACSPILAIRVPTSTTPSARRGPG